ncbi:MAG: hypothetical protein M0Q98_00715 [Pseudomonas sp.]|jgi:hypothetical protein|nr:hypothetical protein [Pseudomonas sp.]MDD2222468.1 hypothetical protein [Pseudomonas sp.]MDY0414592.1 hypothetical protein [Pseudomonas sp.]NLO53454.1 hypothetical protein [Gammaproteobacteria bacterium]
MSDALALSAEHSHALLKLLKATQHQRGVITYRQVIEQLQLPAPSVRRLAMALEQLAAADHAQGWPLRSALVVSQARPAHPQLGFIQCVQQLGRFQALMDEANIAAWLNAELAQVYLFSYPEV